MSHFTVRTECPKCGFEELDIPVTVESEASEGSFDEPPSGMSWITDKVECEECKTLYPAGHFDDEPGMDEAVFDKAADTQRDAKEAARDAEYERAQDR